MEAIRQKRSAGTVTWSPVNISDVPNVSSHGKWRLLFDEIYRLGGDRAMRVQFISKSGAGSCKASLKKCASERGVKIAFSNISADLVGYVWIEKPEERKR